MLDKQPVALPLRGRWPQPSSLITQDIHMPQDNLVKLQCTICKHVNYHTKRNKKKIKAKLELMKYCRWDKKPTLHKEAK